MAADKDALLLKVLKHVPFDGWTRVAVEKADPSAIKCLAEFHAAFPSGIAALIDHFADWADREMAARFSDEQLAHMRVRDRITAQVKARLEVLAPHREAVRRELAGLTMAGHPQLAPQLLWRTASRMWHRAGDTATDFNHYSKRGLLAGVIATTTLYWLKDASPDFADTWAFLDRRIEEVLRLGKGIGGFLKRVGLAA
jgi:ubiquinone biosynthesis protein COQ9